MNLRLLNFGNFITNNAARTRFNLKLINTRGLNENSINIRNELEFSSDEVQATEPDIRDKSRLNPHLKRVMKGEVTGRHFAYQFRLQNLRKYYATYGSESKINPGLCYPTPEELANKIEYENLAYPPLEESLSKMKAKRQQIEGDKRAREEMIARNMLKLPQWRKEMLAREAKKDAETAERLAKKEEVIAEIREVLGYNVNVKDPRFQDMLEKRDEEERKKKKLAKKERAKEKALSDLISGAADQLREAKKQEDQDDDDEDLKKKKDQK